MESQFEFRPGDAVTWRKVARGGYGYVLSIPAYVVKLGNRRVGIGAIKKDGSWEPRWVEPTSLEARNA